MLGNTIVQLQSGIALGDFSCAVISMHATIDVPLCRHVIIKMKSTNSSSQNRKYLDSFEIFLDVKPMFNCLDFMLLLMKILGCLSSVLMKQVNSLPEHLAMPINLARLSTSLGRCEIGT